MKKAVETIKNVIVWMLMIFAVGMMIFTFVSVSTFNKDNRSIFGYKAMIVLSDSMAKTDFSAGDVVFIKEVDPSTLSPGDIITFSSKSRESYGQTVTHKIRSIAKDVNGNPAFVTYGTTTDTDDESLVDYYSIKGKYQFSIPKVGTFFNYLKTVPGYICCILIPFLILIAVQGINTLNVIRSYRKEQADALQAEKDELAAQKKKTEEMAAELEALRAKINKAEESDSAKDSDDSSK